MTEMEEKTVASLLQKIDNNLSDVRTDVATSKEHYKEIKEQLKIVTKLNIEVYGTDGDEGLKARVKDLEKDLKKAKEDLESEIKTLRETEIKPLSERNQQLIGVVKFLGVLSTLLGIGSILISVLK